MHVFRHPKFYEEYRQRAKKEQREQKLKQQATSNKQGDNDEQQATSKRQASKSTSD